MRAILAIPTILALAFTPNVTADTLTAVTPDKFDYTSRYLAGENWGIFKYLNQESWNAVFKGDMGYAHNGIEYEFGHGFTREDTFGFYLWPAPSTATHLLIYRATGGTMGAVLDVVDLTPGFHHVLDHEIFDLSSIQDLNHDGAPELIGVSRAFDTIQFPIQISHADTPYPPLILSPGNGGRFEGANHKYPEFFADAEMKLREKYETTPGQDPIPADTIVAQRKDKFLTFFRWAVHAYYTRGQREAEALIDTHLDPTLADLTKRAIYWQILRDPFFPKELTTHFQEHPEDYQPIQRQPEQ